MPKIPFTVDSALLRELGERLVGKPHIALAELIKNSYDADATGVTVRFDGKQIEVTDNGHGMNFAEFKNFWMRIGTPHKQTQGFSRNLKRPLTGSKGVGRLAVQFLGSKLRIHTVSRMQHNSEVVATVDWEKAVRIGDLTKATAEYKRSMRRTAFPGDSPNGTKIVISHLNQEWNADDFVELAREIWPLRPPFRTNPELKLEKQQAFEVVLKSPNEEIVQQFDQQMSAILDIWYARLFGKLTGTKVPKGESRLQSGRVSLLLEFSDGRDIRHEYVVPNCALHFLEFEVRLFHLEYRQPHGIKVATAREYMNRFGGIHVYDAGFHLPYYGAVNDWLRVEIDHAHRLSRSKLLPDGLQVPGGLSFLPTQSRIFGVVHVNTSKERDLWHSRGGYLKIQVTRDRLVENVSFEHLNRIVRTALDFYAMQEAQRALERFEGKREVEPLREKVVRVEEVLERYREDMPQRVFDTVRSEINDAIEAAETEADSLTRRLGLLGALATAGISAVAYEHESQRQFTLLEDIVEELASIRTRDKSIRKRLGEASGHLGEWLKRERANRALFSHLLQEENRERQQRSRARPLIEEVKKQVSVLMRGIEIRTNDIDRNLRLPRATFAEWSGIFQNAFLNAANAMLDSKRKLISISSSIRGRVHAILVQDTGAGVDIKTAEDLFKPFVRKLEISPERRSLGYGGSGLGLTIVRLIAENIRCRVGFVKPESNFSTAFQLSWREEE